MHILASFNSKMWKNMKCVRWHLSCTAQHKEVYHRVRLVCVEANMWADHGDKKIKGVWDAFKQHGTLALANWFEDKQSHAWHMRAYTKS